MPEIDEILEQEFASLTPVFPLTAAEVATVKIAMRKWLLQKQQEIKTWKFATVTEKEAMDYLLENLLEDLKS